MKHLAGLLCLACLLTAGCASRSVPKVLPPHPNQINTFDGQTYDLLLAAKGAIENAEQLMAAGTLPASAKTTVNAAVRAYDATDAAWSAWRQVATADPGQLSSGASLDALEKDYADLTAALSGLKSLSK